MASPKQYSAKLTDNEVKILGLAWQCFLSQPEIDWQKLADLGGYTNLHSCQNIIRGAKKKVAEMLDASSGGASASRSPLKRKGRKAAVKEEADDKDGDDAADVPTPSKKAKKARAKKTAAQSRARNGKNNNQDRGEEEDSADGKVKLEDMAGEDDLV